MNNLLTRNVDNGVLRVGYFDDVFVTGTWVCNMCKVGHTTVYPSDADETFIILNSFFDDHLAGHVLTNEKG